MNNHQISLHMESQTVHELLGYTALFGPRYRIWEASTEDAGTRQAGQVWTPSALLTHLQQQQDPILASSCTVIESSLLVLKRKEVVWNLLLYTSDSITTQPTAYVIEDRLDIERVHDWLLQRDLSQPDVVLPPDAERSTFLDVYYQEQGGIQEAPTDHDHLPLWVSYVEQLIRSLDPRERRVAPITVGILTLVLWINLIVDVFSDGRVGPYILDDDSQAPLA